MTTLTGCPLRIEYEDELEDEDEQSSLSAGRLRVFPQASRLKPMAFRIPASSLKLKSFSLARSLQSEAVPSCLEQKNTEDTEKDRSGKRPRRHDEHDVSFFFARLGVLCDLCVRKINRPPLTLFTFNFPLSTFNYLQSCTEQL